MKSRHRRNPGFFSLDTVKLSRREILRPAIPCLKVHTGVVNLGSFVYQSDLDSPGKSRMLCGKAPGTETSLDDSQQGIRTLVLQLLRPEFSQQPK